MKTKDSKGKPLPPEKVYPEGTRWRLKIGGPRKHTHRKHVAFATTKSAAVRILRDRGIGSPTVELWP